MNLNVSFFKKSFITGAIIAVSVGAGAVFLAHANAINNSQSATHGPGYEITISNKQGNLSKINPGENPGPCNTKPTAACRCDNNNSEFCKCLKDGEAFCKDCEPSHPAVCWVCPTNPKMMVACRLFDGNSQDNGGGITPTQTDSTGAGTSDGSYIQVAPDHVGPPTSNDPGSNQTTPPSSTPPGSYCPSNPRMGIACVAPDVQNNGEGICTTRMPCGASL